jgi:hypothetical protein
VPKQKNNKKRKNNNRNNLHERTLKTHAGKIDCNGEIGKTRRKAYGKEENSM